MGRFIIANLVVFSMLCASGCNSGPGAKPTAESVKPALEKYLLAQHQHAGANGVNVKELADVRIGEYRPQLKGWEVFSKHAVEYKENGIPITIRSSSDGTSTCLVRSVGGKPECFMPEFFVQMEDEMNEAFAEAFKNM